MQAAAGPPGDLPAPHGPEVAAPVIHLKDEDAISDDGGAVGPQEMAEAVPGAMMGEELEAAEEDETVEELDDLTGLPVGSLDGPPPDGPARPQRQLSPRSKARPQPPAHPPPAHRHWEAARRWGGTTPRWPRLPPSDSARSPHSG
eukprot:9925056-Alexandrium_andersonii.AAC.1